MNELRWILIAASLVLLAWIYWQGRRKGFVSGDQRLSREIEPPQLGETAIVRTRSEPKEPTETIVARARLDADDLPEVHVAPPAGKLTMDAALSTSALEKLTVTQPLRNSPAPSPQIEPTLKTTASRAGAASRSARKIVALRVAAVGQQFSGERLKEWFARHDLRHGKYDIFHRYDENGDLLFSIASMVEPGSFDRNAMSNAHYPGVSFFLQLPSAVDGVTAFDEMLTCAESLQKDFFGNLYGERSAPLTPELTERMRESVADFQHLLSMPHARD